MESRWAKLVRLAKDHYRTEENNSVNQTVSKQSGSSMQKFTDSLIPSDSEKGDFFGTSSDEFRPSNNRDNSSSEDSSSSSSSSSSSEDEHEAKVSVPEASITTHVSTISEPVEPKKAKKRTKTPNNWKRVRAKQLKNTGKEYLSRTGKYMSGKAMGPPSSFKCTLVGASKLSEEEKQAIFNSYWELTALCEQGSTTPMLPPLNTVPSGNLLKISSTSQTTTLDFTFQNLPFTEDPKTPNKEDQSSTQESCNTDNMVIPSPFKRALFWPTPKQNSKGRRKEKVPSVVSSLEWQRYHENKEKKKIELEIEKQRRAEERKNRKKRLKKIANLRLIRKEWVESGDSVNDISDEVTDEEREEERNEEESRIKQGGKFPGKKIITNMFVLSKRSDVCSTCLQLDENIKKETNAETKNKLIIEKRVHRLRFKAFYEILQEQRSDLLTMSFDCQKNLGLPKVPDQSAYYSRQINFYNFTIVALRQN
ncbi:hypothetical protein HF086_000357 [Spodoptera exigua]|uniref:Uncharacterized protein n=1 Tax=Spodoptera exigua TaxID=7107 RepID=A0A922M9S1_SPOEX|nr:hypothetical protein HF086_000357 [Spodoptera exigua]